MSLAMQITRNAALASLLLLGLSACGGGGGSASGPQLKKVTLAFSSISAAHAAPLNGIALAVQMPAGVTVGPSSCTVNWHLATGNVQGATPDPVTRRVTLNYVNSSLPIPFGAIADLTCDMDAGSTLQVGDFSSASLLIAADTEFRGYPPVGDSIQLDKITAGIVTTISNR